MYIDPSRTIPLMQLAAKAAPRSKNIVPRKVRERERERIKLQDKRARASLRLGSEQGGFGGLVKRRKWINYFRLRQAPETAPSRQSGGGDSEMSEGGGGGTGKGGWPLLTRLFSWPFS